MPLNDTDKATANKLAIVHEQITFLRDERRHNRFITLDASHAKIQQVLGKPAGEYTEEKLKAKVSFDIGGVDAKDAKDAKLPQAHIDAFKKMMNVDDKKQPGITLITQNLFAEVKGKATSVVNQLLTQNPTDHKCNPVALDAWKAAFQDPLKKFDQEMKKKIDELDKLEFKDCPDYAAGEEAVFATNKAEQIKTLQKLKDDVRKEVEAQQNTTLMEAIQSAEFCDDRTPDAKADAPSLISSPLSDDIDILNKGVTKNLKSHFVLSTAQHLELEEKLWAQQVTNADSSMWHTRGKIIKNADDLTQEDNLVGIYDTTSRWKKNRFIHMEEHGVRIYPADFGTNKDHIRTQLLLYTQKTGSRSGILQAGKKVKFDDLMAIARVSSEAGYTLTLGDETAKTLKEGGVSPEQIASLRAALRPVSAAPAPDAVPFPPPVP